MTKDNILETFTHKGVYGVVPVYMLLEDAEWEDGDRLDEILMSERNWIPEFCLPLFVLVWNLFTFMYPYPPPLYITGEL